jgi:hypothetical protein
MPKSKKNRRSEHDSEILRGLAHGPWTMRWASEQEEQGESFSGMDIYELAPEAPRWVARWASAVADTIVQINGRSLEDLYLRAQGEGFTKNRETFGYYLGMQATGEGVRWDDDLSGTDLKIKVPSGELYEGTKPDLRFISD